MNAKLLTLLALHLTCAGLFAQAVTEAVDETTEKIRYKLILPDEKTPEVVKPNEPNPFNKGDGTIITADESNSEENRVKDMLLAMRVSGIGRHSDGTVRRVMLGGIPLERGMTVPPVLPDQDVSLRVNSLSDTTIELFWIEKKKRAGLPPRPVIIPINNTPTVRYLLPTPSPAELAQPPATGTGGRSFGRQSSPLLASPVDPNQLPAPRAVLVDDTEAQPQSKTEPLIAKPGDPTEKKALPTDPSHPANLFMNLLMNKSAPTQKPAQ